MLNRGVSLFERRSRWQLGDPNGPSRRPKQSVERFVFQLRAGPRCWPSGLQSRRLRCGSPRSIVIRVLHFRRGPVLAIPQRSQVRLGLADLLCHLHHDAVALEGQLIAGLNGLRPGPVHVSDEIARHIVDHDALVEGVVAEEAILPLLRLLPTVVRVEAFIFQHRRRVLRQRHRQGRRRFGHCSRHGGLVARSSCQVVDEVHVPTEMVLT